VKSSLPPFRATHILEPMLGRPFGYSVKHCSTSLLKKDFICAKKKKKKKKDFIPFLITPSLPHVHFFHFSVTCSLGFNDSIKFLESLFSLIPFERAGPTLVLECYDKVHETRDKIFNKRHANKFCTVI
jgi:hypothetical protein